jgi:hypothetical protein
LQGANILERHLTASENWCKFPEQNYFSRALVLFKYYSSMANLRRNDILTGKIALFFKWKTCRNEESFLLQKEIGLFCIFL